MAKTKLIEKIGYGFGDMSSSTFWKVFSYYLPIFYSNIFGLSLVDAGVLSKKKFMIDTLGYTEEEAKNELAQIAEERKTNSVVVDRLFGGME